VVAACAQCLRLPRYTELMPQIETDSGIILDGHAVDDVSMQRR
jgi:hypothetical protein